MSFWKSRLEYVYTKEFGVSFWPLELKHVYGPIGLVWVSNHLEFSTFGPMGLMRFFNFSKLWRSFSRCCYLDPPSLLSCLLGFYELVKTPKHWLSFFLFYLWKIKGENVIHLVWSSKCYILLCREVALDDMWPLIYVVHHWFWTTMDWNTLIKITSSPIQTRVEYMNLEWFLNLRWSCFQLVVPFVTCSLVVCLLLIC